MNRRTPGLLLLLLAFSFPLHSAPYGRGGGVATVSSNAPEGAAQAIQKGGNAVDAAGAAALTLGVVDGHNSGIGGGCFLLIRTERGAVIAIDGREKAPAKATRDRSEEHTSE